LTLALSVAVPLRSDGRGGVSAEFVLSEGESQIFAFGTTAASVLYRVRRAKKRQRSCCGAREILAKLALRLYLPWALAGAWYTGQLCR